MRSLLLVLLLLIPSIIFSQSKHFIDTPDDSLKKYSYSFMGFSSANLGQMASGTCFFIRDNKRLFLITAAHVVNGCNDSAKKEYGFPDILNVLIPSEKGFDGAVLNVPIKKIIDTFKCESALKRADIISIQVFPHDSIADNIYSVEKFILPYFEKIKTITVTGYPMTSYDSASKFGEWTPVTHSFNGEESLIISYTTYSDWVDSINFYIYNKNEKIDTFFKGISGSPVFLKDNKTGKFRIAGLLSSIGTSQHPLKQYILVPKMELILKELHRVYN